ncbi:MAG: hypothetical protein WCV84_01945 [Patescibacteria group bacterium]
MRPKHFNAPDTSGEAPKDKKKVAIAIHPLGMYENRQNKEFIQAMFDNPNFDLTVAVAYGKQYDDPDWSLFVRAKQVISSPLFTGADIASGKIKYHIIKPEDFSHLFETAKELQITLMGGESPETKLATGCHRAAFHELIKWFFDQRNLVHETMKIYIPFKSLFTAFSLPVDYHDEKWVELFRQKYAPEHPCKAVVGKSGAIFTFRKQKT